MSEHQHRGWSIKHDPLPLPFPHKEWAAFHPDWTPFDARLTRAHNEDELRRNIDRWEALDALCH